MNLVSQLRATVYTGGYSDNYSGLLKYTTYRPKNCMKCIFCRNYKNVDIKLSAHGLLLDEPSSTPPPPSNYNGMHPVSDLPICIGRLKPRASKSRGPLATVSNNFGTVIGISYICYHGALKSINNPSIICSQI